MEPQYEHQSWVNYPGWQYPMQIVTHHCQESNTVAKIVIMEASHLEHSLTLPYAFLPLADLTPGNKPSLWE